jgi:hypothetical protein
MTRATAPAAARVHCERRKWCPHSSSSTQQGRSAVGGIENPHHGAGGAAASSVVHASMLPSAPRPRQGDSSRTRQAKRPDCWCCPWWCRPSADRRQRAQAVTFIAAGLVLIAAFVAWQRRARAPMLPLRLFASRTFADANTTAFLMSATIFAAAFLVVQYFQFALGNSPLSAGLRLLPWTATPLVVAPLRTSWPYSGGPGCVRARSPRTRCCASSCTTGWRSGGALNRSAGRCPASSLGSGPAMSCTRRSTRPSTVVSWAGWPASCRLACCAPAAGGAGRTAVRASSARTGSSR